MENPTLKGFIPEEFMQRSEKLIRKEKISRIFQEFPSRVLQLQSLDVWG